MRRLIDVPLGCITLLIDLAAWLLLIFLVLAILFGRAV